MTEEIKTASTEAGQKAAAEALEQIKNRSYAGRHPELGKMINCQYCGLRHRENDQLRKCKQTFVTKTREGDLLQGELQPPEGMTQLTTRQIFGAAMFNRRRQRPRNRPKNKMHHWLRVILDARKKRDAEKV
jgi:hypothetical protein